MERFYFFLLSAVLFSCNNKAVKKEAGFTTTKSNFDYKIITLAGGGDTLLRGDIAKIHLRQFMDDSVMNDTYKGMPVYIKIDSTLREFDLSEIVPLMKVNDSAVCIFSTKEILKRAAAETHAPGFLERGKNIKVYFKVIAKFSADSLAEQDMAAEQKRYDSAVALRENAAYKIAAVSFDSLIKSIKTPLTKLPNGIFVQMLQKGNGAKIKSGDSVDVVYKGMLSNGHVFESTTRAEPFTLRPGQGDAVEGFDAGIASLSFGDKAKIYIPAKLAYGPNPAGGKIPAFANLIFEVEIMPGK